MSRPALFVVLGGVLLLAAVIGLRMMMQDDEPAKPAPAAAPEVAAPAAAPAPAPVPTAPAPAVAHTAPSATGAPPAAATGTPELPSAAPAAAVAERRPPIANKHVLKEQVAANEAQVVACAQQAGYAGTGTAVFTYSVTPDNQRHDVTIEPAGVDFDQTTVDSQPLLDCLKDTPKAMKFTWTADTDGVLAMRRIKFEGGKLVENTLIDFYYIR